MHNGPNEYSIFFGPSRFCDENERMQDRREKIELMKRLDDAQPLLQAVAKIIFGERRQRKDKRQPILDVIP